MQPRDNKHSQFQNANEIRLAHAQRGTLVMESSMKGKGATASLHGYERKVHWIIQNSIYIEAIYTEAL